jgi:hypothetical protein
MAFVSAASAGNRIDERASCVYTCGGSYCYYQSDIDAAVAKGYSLYESGQTLGERFPYFSFSYFIMDPSYRRGFHLA